MSTGPSRAPVRSNAVHRRFVRTPWRPRTARHADRGPTHEEGTAAAREGHTREPAAPGAADRHRVRTDHGGYPRRRGLAPRRRPAGRRFRLRPGRGRRRAAVDPVGNAVAAVRDSGERHDRISRLEQENTALRQKLGTDDRNRARSPSSTSCSRPPARGQYGIKGAEVIAHRRRPGLLLDRHLDAGSDDGIRRDMTVLNGDGLVGRVTTVGPSTSTVLLAIDPDFTVGTRMEKCQRVRLRHRTRRPPLHVQLLNGKARIKRATGWSPSAPRPTSRSCRASRSARWSGRPAPAATSPGPCRCAPTSRFSRLDIVGVVVQPPRKDPRDTVLPPKPPKPKPTPTVTVTANRSRHTPRPAPTGADRRAPQPDRSCPPPSWSSPWSLQVSVLARLQLPGAVPDLLLLVVLGARAGLRPHRAARFRLRRRAARRPRPARRPRRGPLRAGAVPHRLPRRAGQARRRPAPVGHRADAVVASARPSAPRCCTREWARSSGTPRPAMSGLGELLFTAALYDLLLAPFTVPLVMGLARRRGERPAGRQLAAAPAARARLAGITRHARPRLGRMQPAPAAARAPGRRPAARLRGQDGSGRRQDGRDRRGQAAVRDRPPLGAPPRSLRDSGRRSRQPDHRPSRRQP